MRRRLARGRCDVIRGRGRRGGDLQAVDDRHPDRRADQRRPELDANVEDVRTTFEHVGTPDALVATIDAWVAAGAADGFVVRPSSLSTDLDALVDKVVPTLQSAGLFRTAYPGRTLRDTLGLARPANVFAATA